MAAAYITSDGAHEALVTAMGTSALGDVLLREAGAICDAEEIFGFWVERGRAPVQLASSGHRGSARARAALYVDRFHEADPLLSEIFAVDARASIEGALLCARDIADPIYRRECFERPGLSEKISFVRRDGKRCYVLNFYRQGRARQVDVDALAKLARLSMPVLKRHGAMLGDEVGLSLTGRIELRLSRSCPALTERERQVCARSLSGMTAEATALDLGIAATSVLTFRRRAYQRFGISHAGELLENILG